MATRNASRAEIGPVNIDIQKLSKQMTAGAKNLKKRYETMDTKTKKRLVTGIAAVSSLLLGAAIVRKMAGKKRK